MPLSRLLLLFLPLPFMLASVTMRDPAPRGSQGSPTATGLLRGDQYGDPLPEGAVAPLGTLRWRHTGRILCLSVSPDGKTLASAGKDQTLRLWDAATGKQLHRIDNPA